jgi:hypothetical protein
MKNILIALIVMLSMSDVRSQPYNSIFGNISTSWNTKQTQLFGDYTDSLYYVGDTTINSQIFKKFNLYTLGQILPDYTGFIHEDTLTGRAWYYSTADTNKLLIMDLSLQLSDSFMVNDFSSATPSAYYLVDSIYYMSGKKHIRLNYVFQFLPTNQSINEKFVMIEGVGTNLGVKYQELGMINFAPYLLCQYKNSAFDYGNVNPNYVNSCSLLTANKEQTKNSLHLEIFPNPTNGLLFIKTNNQNKEIRSLTIYNAIGQNIHQNFNIKKDIIAPIDMQYFENGVYTLIVETSMDTKQFKIIKN